MFTPISLLMRGIDTTRSPRLGEEHGRDYFFISRSVFEELRDKNHFIEWAQFSNNLYGTSFEAVRACQAAGKTCVLDIDLQGVKSVKRDAPDLHARYIFIRPPTFEDLRTRLTARNTETEASLNLRLQTAFNDMKFADENPGFYDVIIVNDDVDVAYEQLRNFILNPSSDGEVKAISNELQQ